MSPRKQEHNEQMRAEALAKINGAALIVFAQYGYHGATMKQIARITGLSYGLVYHYFPSKEKVFRNLLDFALEIPMAALNAIFDGPGTAWEKIENLSAILVGDSQSGDSSLYFFFVLQAMTQGKGIPGVPGLIDRRFTAYYEKFIPFIIQAQKSGEAVKGDPAALAAAYFSFVQGLALLAFQGKGMEKKITPGILLSVLRNGQSRVKP
jgi:AcrR family transcriptional regulator